MSHPSELVKLDINLGSTKATFPQRVKPAQHTMVEGTLEQYVRTKFHPDQQEALKKAAQSGTPVEVHGLFSDYLPELLGQRGYVLKAQHRHHSREGKLFNNRRPVVCECADDKGAPRLLALVSPSKEYVDQYAELIDYFVASHAGKNKDGKRLVQTFHYPEVEQGYARISHFKSGLKNVLIPGDICVMGEVAYISEALKHYNFIPVDDKFHAFGRDGMYGWKLHVSERTHRRLLLIGCQESFWGSASAKLARELAELGAKHVIYAAKCGSTSEESDIHKPVCPQDYYICEQSSPSPGVLNYDVKKVKNPPPSSLRDHYSGLVNVMTSGIHLTVPTVMGETIGQQQVYSRVSPRTIDNEISYIARELSQYNQQQKKETPVEFTALHFVTDYVRRFSDRDVVPKFDLSVKGEHDGGRVDNAKVDCFNLIASIIDTFAYHEGQRHEDETHQYGIIGAIGNWSRLKDEIHALGVGDARVYWRRDFPKLLDGWVAAYYAEELELYEPLIDGIASRHVLRGPNMEAAVEWCFLACHFARLLKRPQNDPKLLLEYINLIGIAESNLGLLEEQARSADSSDHPSKVLRGIYGDLIGACLVRTASFTTSEADRRDIAGKAVSVLERASELLSASRAPESTRVIWHCWIEKYLATAYKLRGDNAAAAKQARAVANRFEKYLKENEVRENSFTGLFLFGELSLFRLKALEYGGINAVPKWHRPLEKYCREESHVFFKAVKDAYGRLFDKPGPASC